MFKASNLWQIFINQSFNFNYCLRNKQAIKQTNEQINESIKLERIGQLKRKTLTMI